MMVGASCMQVWEPDEAFDPEWVGLVVEWTGVDLPGVTWARHICRWSWN
jgi:hypothetical protein